MSKVCDICEQAISNKPGILADNGHHLNQRCYQRATNKATALIPLGCILLIPFPMVISVIGIVLGGYGRQL